MADPIAEAYVKISADMAEMEKSFKQVQESTTSVMDAIEAKASRMLESLNESSVKSASAIKSAMSEVKDDVTFAMATAEEKAYDSWLAQTESALNAADSIKSSLESQLTAAEFTAATSEEAMADAWLASLEAADNSAKATSNAMSEMTSLVSSKLVALGGIIAATFTVSSIIDFFKGATEEYEKSEQSLRKLEASLQATGNQTGYTKEEILSLGQQLSDLTGYSGEAITAVQTIIATFAGVSGKNFEDVTKVVLDMSALFGGDAESNAMLLARALSEPETAAQKLEKSVYKLTDAQKESIQQFIDVGDKAGAAGVILDSFKSKVDGAAERTNTGLTGALRSANSAWDDFEKTVGKVIAESITPIINLFKDWAKELDTNNSYVEKLKGSIIILNEAMTLLLQFVNGVKAAFELGLAAVVSFENFLIGQLFNTLSYITGKLEELSNSAGLTSLSKWFGDASEQTNKLANDFGNYASAAKDQFISVANSAADNYNAIEKTSKAINDAMVSNSKDTKDAINKLRDEELAHAKQVEEDKQKAAAAANAERINSTKSSLQEIILNEWDYLSTMGTISDSLVNDVYKWAAQQGVAWEETSIEERRSLISAFLTEQYNMENSTLNAIHESKVAAAEADKALQDSLGKSLYDIEQEQAQNSINTTQSKATSMSQSASDVYASWKNAATDTVIAWGDALDSVATMASSVSSTIIDTWDSVASLYNATYQVATSTSTEGSNLIFGSLGSQGAWASGSLATYSAKGNIFDSSGLVPFADGGIVSQPTLFGFGNGQTGVMGEAGTEVIMPIARNSQGEMGVKVADSGGMGTYVVNLMMDGAVLASQMFKMSKTGELKLSPRSIVDSNMAGI